MTAIKEFPDYIEFYDLAAPKNNLDISQHYFNHFELFEMYQHFFKEHAAALIQTVDQNRLNALPTVQETIVKPQFYDEVKDLIQPRYFPLRHNTRDIKVTQAEKRCLLMMVEGATAKQTAIELGNVSPRTIETHLTNLRHKFCVGFTSESL